MKEDTVKTWRPFSDSDELMAIWDKKIGAYKMELFLPLIWVKSKATGDKLLVTVYTKDGVYTGHGLYSDWENLMEYFTFLDGTPCGVQV